MLRSCTLLALSVCTLTPAHAFLNHEHHSIRTRDTRVSVTLVNKSTLFRDVKVGDQTYTVHPAELLTVKAPAGTTIYAESWFGKYHRGDAFLQLTPAMDHARVSIN